MIQIPKRKTRFRDSLVFWGAVALFFGATLIALSRLVPVAHPDGFWEAAAAVARSDTLWEILGALGEAAFVAGIFTFAFEFAGKKKLIEEAVEQAAGQVRAVTFGLYNFVETPHEIDYNDGFEMSSVLMVSSRYSAEALIPYRSDLIKRFRSGRTLIFLREKTLDPNLPARPRPSQRQSVEAFLGDLLSRHPEFLEQIKFYETNRRFMYNFVVVDDGIWIKLYYNAPADDLPPAFFAKRNTRLHHLYEADIRGLLNEKGTTPIDLSKYAAPGESGD